MSGLSSSLAFTPVQGIELVNPTQVCPAIDCTPCAIAASPMKRVTDQAASPLCAGGATWQLLFGTGAAALRCAEQSVRVVARATVP